MIDTCPLCAADLCGDLIAEVRRTSSGRTHYSRMIGHVEHGIYDGIVFWSCPDCGGAWHRWPEGSRVRELAQPLVDAVNAQALVR